MATVYELDTFVQKFRQLWKCGHESHLNVESKNGKAWVNLRLCLDDEPGPQHHQPSNFPKFKTSPSRERRKVRREIARQENVRKESETTFVAEKAEDVGIKDKVHDNAAVEVARHETTVTTEKLNNTEEGIMDEVDAVVEVAEHVPTETNAVESEEEVRENASEVANKANEVVDMNNSDVIVTEDNHEETKAKESIAEKAVDDKSKNEDRIESKPVRPLIEMVYATAVIEESNASKITDAEIKVLSSIIRSKEHLNRNINSLNIGSIQSYEIQGGKFEHIIQIVLSVNTVTLWESSRSYIYHHLGRDMWNLSDGTQITFKKIHQKMY